MPHPRTFRFSTLTHGVLPALFVFMFFTGVTLLASLMSTMFQDIQTRNACEQQRSDEFKKLVREREMLQSNLNGCRTSKKSASLLMETAKYLREENKKLLTKVKRCELDSGQDAKQGVASHTTSLDDQSNLHNNERKVIVNEAFFQYMATYLQDTPYPGVENYTQYAVVRLNLAPLTNVEPLIPEFGPVLNDVLSFQYTTSVPSCPAATTSVGKPTVFIAVISAIFNFHRRTTIRRTWKSHVQAVHRNGPLAIAGFAFILGLSEDDGTQRQIEEESKLYADIIQIRMSDFYRNLPLKIAGLLNWLRSYCAGEITFLLKVDDDVYVNVHNLVHFVRSYRHSYMTVFGSGSPIKGYAQREDKWQISYAEWPWNEYPPYILGAISLTSGSSIHPLLAACQTTPMLPFEDVYFFGLCAEKAGIKTRYSIYPTGPLRQDTNQIPTTCELKAMIAWRVHNEDGTKWRSMMESSHQAVDDFYTNTTQCVMNGTRKPVDHIEPVYFTFTT
ncbi:lactosylceramide 1,3-N-acetyl-beta-D-glucosaminyltransferase-like [Daphnia magna]|uniref:lactosylceramide 1,3-N-acetyl-beta-D-glucosaminyltransferase-like n=1 Tax=Daphnia magna TaxID=35525 RepID=UPI001E1BBA3B|nr:lactosylceramide 1,3-N-acetyl-beta-D-glucosaminyltransferase-like [Daphnia magna]XP_045032182.1 lactosylceramide 1,3-N-acetyl-beta-D-glucosaminyltransferase-like [Daphnia magna]